MPIIGTNLGASVAGSQAAERAARDVPKPGPRVGATRRRETDELIVGAEETAPTQAIRGLEGNDQEEAREDRQQHDDGGYNVHGKKKGVAPRSIDVAG